MIRNEFGPTAGMTASILNSVGTFINIISQTAAYLPAALGIGGCIVLTGTDLSAGRIVGLTACISASLLQSVEASRGEFGVYIESRGDKYPYRMKFRSPCLPLVSVVDLLACGGKIADLIAIGGTLDYVVPDVDR